MATIGVERLSTEIVRELGLYSQNVKDELDKITKHYATELVKKTKATAPIGNRTGNKYKNSIKCKKIHESVDGITYAWYVDSKDSNYRLTHLLVHGHALRNGGRSRGNDFLQKAVDEITKDYIEAVEEVLKNG